MAKFKVAAVQLLITEDKNENIRRACEEIQRCADAGCKLVLLPECWNCPYGNDFFPSYAESIPDGPSTRALAEAAKRSKVFIVGGSIPEREWDGKLFNTCLVFDPSGEIVAKHRKVHLFDISVPGGITFQESLTLSPGNSITMFEGPEGCRVGVGICYDMRFPELAQLYVSKGCRLLCYPGAFNMTTGPAHWELLQRSRALDNQVFVITASPSRVPGASYQAWGHSTITDPWGTVLATTEHEPAVVMAELDLQRQETVRQSIPVLKQKRTDLYETVFRGPQ
eukprot:tig00000949_g5737.t1